MRRFIEVTWLPILIALAGGITVGGLLAWGDSQRRRELPFYEGGKIIFPVEITVPPSRDDGEWAPPQQAVEKVPVPKGGCPLCGRTDCAQYPAGSGLGCTNTHPPEIYWNWPTADRPGTKDRVHPSDLPEN